jgi:hypothetical protein
MENLRARGVSVEWQKPAWVVFLLAKEGTLYSWEYDTREEAMARAGSLAREYRIPILADAPLASITLAWMEAGRLQEYKLHNLSAREAWEYARHLKRSYRRQHVLACASVTIGARVVWT